MQGNHAVIVLGSVGCLEDAGRNEIRSPTPDILIDVGPRIGGAEVATRIVEADACFEPVGEVGLQIEHSIIAGAFAGVELHDVSLRVVT